MLLSEEFGFTKDQVKEMLMKEPRLFMQGDDYCVHLKGELMAILTVSKIDFSIPVQVDFAKI